MKDANYRKHNDGSLNSSTYHKKDGTPSRQILKREAEEEITEEQMNDTEEGDEEMTDLERQLAAFEPIKSLIDPGPRLTKAEKCRDDAPSLWVLNTTRFWENIPEFVALDIRVGQAKRWIDRWLLRDVPEDWYIDYHCCRASASASDRYHPNLRHLGTITRIVDCRNGHETMEELEGRSLAELYALIVAWMHEHSEHEKQLRAIRRNQLRNSRNTTKIK